MRKTDTRQSSRKRTREFRREIALIKWINSPSQNENQLFYKNIILITLIQPTSIQLVRPWKWTDQRFGGIEKRQSKNFMQTLIISQLVTSLIVMIWFDVFAIDMQIKQLLGYKRWTSKVEATSNWHRLFFCYFVRHSGWAF